MAHLRCIKALDITLAMWDFQAALSSLADTSENGLHIDVRDILQAWNNIMEKRGVDIETLIE